MRKHDLILFEMGQLDQTGRVIFLNTLRELLADKLEHPVSDFDLLLASDEDLEHALSIAKK